MLRSTPFLAPQSYRMSLARSTSVFDVKASLASAPESARKKCVTFNLNLNEKHIYERQISLEETITEENLDKELEQALDSGKLSQEDMMKELLELCGWKNGEENEDCNSIPSDSGGSFSFDISSSIESSDISKTSTPTKLRSRDKFCSISSKFNELRLNTSPYGRTQKVSRLASTGLKKMPRNQASWWDDINKGIIRDDNTIEPPVFPEPIKTSSPEKEEYDFWKDVEF